MKIQQTNLKIIGNAKPEPFHIIFSDPEKDMKIIYSLNHTTNILTILPNTEYETKFLIKKQISKVNSLHS